MNLGHESRGETIVVEEDDEAEEEEEEWKKNKERLGSSSFEVKIVILMGTLLVKRRQKIAEIGAQVVWGRRVEEEVEVEEKAMAEEMKRGVRQGNVNAECVESID